ncbi:MAG: ROK family protein [Clostridia bacterium]|nr:ROK family protein [Clostridia bacterium]
MYYIGVDIGGTGVKAGIVDENGHILYKESIRTGAERPYSEVIVDIAGLCQKIIDGMHLSIDQISAIGVGVPGICDPKTGVIPFCTNLGWHEVPFIADMHKYFPGIPVFVDNDATVAGLAESVAGVSAGTQSSVFITLGTGVGGSIVINGRPYSGSHGVGSEIGHMVIRMDGEPCTCGKKGCFERYASATAIIREARRALPDHPESMIAELCENNPDKIEARTVFDAAKEKDPLAVRLFNNYVKALAHGIVNVINTIDPEIIVLGGGVSNAGEFLLEAVREAVKPFIFYKTQPYATIQLAQLGSDAGVIGAAMLGKQ